jgi:hypothetical protein
MHTDGQGRIFQVKSSNLSYELFRMEFHFHLKTCNDNDMSNCLTTYDESISTS